MTLLVLIISSLVNKIDTYAQQLTEWKNYSSNKLGIHFEYPYNWTVKEKSNRFDEGPDLNASNDLNSFSVTIPIPYDRSNQSDLISFSSMWNQDFISAGKHDHLRAVEGFNFDKYHIDDKETASALYVMDGESGKKIVKQIFLIKQDNGIYELVYQNSADKFDSKESQDTINHILKSFTFSNSDEKRKQAERLIFILTNASIPGAQALGVHKAPITIVEFGDYQCAICASFNNDVKNNLTSNYIDKGIVNFVFKDLILNDLPQDKLSTYAAEATYCAAEQNKYWPYHNELYKNYNGENTGWISRDSLIGFANNVIINDIGQFTSCLDSHKYNQVVMKNDLFGRDLGLDTPPIFFFTKQNSTKVAAIQGFHPYSDFVNVIDQLLNITA
jgi:protein-disulfide isomerase